MSTYKIINYPIVYSSNAEVTATGAGAVGANAATLSTISGISIAAGHLVKISFQFRKTAGAFAPTLGIKLNGTQWISTADTLIRITSVDATAAGWWTMEFHIPEANYPPGNSASNSFNNALIDWSAIASEGSVDIDTAFQSKFRSWVSVNIPNGPLTSVTVTGDAKNAAVTIATQSLKVIDMG